MNNLEVRRLTKKSQALALDEFQSIALNLSLIKVKDKEENDSLHSIGGSSLKNGLKISQESISDISLEQNASNIKLSQNSLLEVGNSMSKEKFVTSSASSLIKQMENRSLGSQSKIRIWSRLEAKVGRSLEETILKVAELNKLEFVRIEGQKQDDSHLLEPKHSPTVSMEGADRRDICRDKTCLGSSIHLPPINRTESQNVAWDIKCLGVPQAVENKPALSIQRVNLRRKERHDYIIKEIDLRMNDLNEVIGQEIRQQAESVVSNIHMIKDSVEQIISTIKEKPCSFNKNLVIRMQEIIKQLNDSRLSKIDSFCDFARNLERHRSDRLKLILKNAYKEMHDNMYLVPYEIQKFFEKKVQHLNEITMNNYHCYTELGSKLKLQMEEEMRLWFQVLKCNETKITIDEEIKESSSFREPSPELSEETVEGPTKEDILKKIEKAEEDFHRLKKVANNLKYLKSHPSMEVFENYLGEMRNAASALFHAGLIGRLGLCLDQKAIQDLSILHCIDEEELTKMWSDGIQEMLGNLDNNLRSFSNSTRVFNRYYDRLEEMRSLYRQQRFLLLTKNEKQTMQMNNIMNLLIDTLRQDANEDSLNKTFQQIQATILSIDTLIQNHLKEETALVNKFLQLALSNVDILLDELDRFIKQFVPPPEADPRKMKKRESWMDIDELRTNYHLFSKEFLNCRFLMQGVDNWQFGVWHALITTMDTSKQVIAIILGNWANTEKQMFARISELKMKSNNVRIHNIKEDFWKVRLAELKIHEVRFLQHELAIREKLAELVSLKRGMEQTCRNFLDTDYNNRINEILDQYTKIQKERHVSSMINKLKGLGLSASIEMKERHERFKEEYYSILINVRNSHIDFMNSIRLFSEDGNFTADEAKALIKKITALEKLMYKEFSNNKENIESIYEDFLDDCEDKLDIPLHSLYKTLEEFTFKDEVERRVRKLHREIGEDVVDLTYDVRKLNVKIRSCRDAAYSRENLGSYTFLFSFSRCYKEILANISVMAEKLFYDDNLALNEKLLKQKFEISQVSLSPTIGSKVKKNMDSKTNVDEKVSTVKKFERKRSIRSTSALIKTKSYVFVLYPRPPQDDGSFFSTMHLKMYASYCEIQEVAKIFYETHGEILDYTRLPPDYKSFVEGMLLKYKYYQLQLEFAWLECTIEFHDILTNFSTFLGNYYRDTLSKYFEFRYDLLMGKCSEVMRILGESMKSVEDNYTSIHNKLKPMFGHPERERTLTIVIETYMGQAEDFNKRTLLDILEPSKESIKDHCIKTEAIFLDMEKILSCIKGSTTLLTLSSGLEVKLAERMEVLQKILFMDDSDVDMTSQTNLEIDMKKKLQEYKKKAPIPTECVITYESIAQSTSSLASTTQLDVEELIKNNFDEYEKIDEKIEKLRTKCSNLEDKYKTMWAQDIERILNLYKVKYDQAIPE